MSQVLGSKISEHRPRRPRGRSPASHGERLPHEPRFSLPALHPPAKYTPDNTQTVEQKSPPLPHARPIYRGDSRHHPPTYLGGSIPSISRFHPIYLTVRLILDALLILEALLMPRLPLAPPCGCCARGLPPPWLTPSPDAMEARCSAAAAAAAARVSCWVLTGVMAPAATRDGGAAPPAAAASTSRAACTSAASSASLFDVRSALWFGG